MKKVIRILIYTVLIFAAVVLPTAKLERAFDGNDNYGYPLTFFTEYSGMVADPGANPTSSFKFLNLIIDLVPVTILAVLVEWAISKLIAFRKSSAK